MTKFGLLDPRPLDDGEEPRILKCEECGMEFSDQDEIEIDDFDSIEETGLCCVCYALWKR